MHIPILTMGKISQSNHHLNQEKTSSILKISHKQKIARTKMKFFRIYLKEV